jgi:hypothetical protein
MFWSLPGNARKLQPALKALARKKITKPWSEIVNEM